MSITVLHVTVCDLVGGASRAAYRIHRALVAHGQDGYSVYSGMRVITKVSGDPTVTGGVVHPRLNKVRRLLQRFYRHWYRRSFVTPNSVPHSTAWPATGLGRELSDRQLQGTADLVHLHWLGDSTLSIEEVGHLNQPLVWTLHDQWAFCGAEHYTTPPGPNEIESMDRRFELAYSPASRPIQERGPDLNRRTWVRKCQAWRRPIHIVCPSTWLAGCARRSTLVGGWPITVIPNPLDLEVWAPWSKPQARDLLGLPQDRPLILFGADGGTRDPRKGADLLLKALEILHTRVDGAPLAELELVVFGQAHPGRPPNFGFPIHYTGRVSDDLRLRLLYVAADAFVIPSRQDNLPNTGLEAHACGTPVVAFRSGGLTDVVDDRSTGALADPFSPASLAQAIAWVLREPQRSCQLGAAARRRAERLWNPQRISNLYSEVYKEVAENA